MAADISVTLDDVRSVSVALAAALRRHGATSAAGMLEDALDTAPRHEPEALLDLRSALVRTQTEWEPLSDGPLVRRARRVLAAAKRLAIEIPPQ